MEKKVTEKEKSYSKQHAKYNEETTENETGKSNNQT